MRHLTLLLTAAAAVLGLTACGSDDEPAVPLAIAGGESGAAMWFDPDQPAVARGAYEITFDNVGQVIHELAIMSPSGEFVGARSIPGGTAVSFEADLSEPGTYEMQCREPGHTQAGMVGSITVG